MAFKVLGRVVSRVGTLTFLQPSSGRAHKTFYRFRVFYLAVAEFFALDHVSDAATSDPLFTGRH